ncbi:MULTISPECIES: hypothetical protein [Spirosoma]|uniref:Uncharacterized protein n=1 Tax=Spirosoma sordidisoli TaxID=2502893 RepID=A0A4Q2UQA2_9BACT|nr:MULTISPECIES: hypothetical protein [Spirosoma]RYC69820.1 hypothetical protein EQG79_14600 [Spirosoma sordidisoli]
MTEQDYIDYFARLASQHTAIRHSAAEPRFYVVHDDNRTELELALRNKLYLPCLLLDQYYDDQDRTADNHRLRILGGLAVLVKCNPADPADKRRARTEARTIALQFVNRMFDDCRRPTSLLGQKRVVAAKETNGEPTPVIGSGVATGWGYSFEWVLPTRVATQPGTWLDLP